MSHEKKKNFRIPKVVGLTHIKLVPHYRLLFEFSIKRYQEPNFILPNPLARLSHLLEAFINLNA